VHASAFAVNVGTHPFLVNGPDATAEDEERNENHSKSSEKRTKLTISLYCGRNSVLPMQCTYLVKNLGIFDITVALDRHPFADDDVGLLYGCDCDMHVSILWTVHVPIRYAPPGTVLESVGYSSHSATHRVPTKI
jgi:hypothetical protein